MSQEQVDKQALREQARARRRARPIAEREASASALAEQVTRIPGYGAATTVTAYASFGTEPGTGPLLGRLVADGKAVLLPIVHDDGTLGWVSYTGPESLRPSARGIPEPVGVEVGAGAAAVSSAGVDLMLIPALVVDLSGNRIGKGGGFYDRVLAQLPDDRPRRVAVLHDDDMQPAGVVPADTWDQRVHSIVTPSRLIELAD